MTQEDFVLEYLLEYGSIDSREAIAHGIYRLSARVKELRNRGVNIITRRKPVKTHWRGQVTFVADYIMEDTYHG